MDQEQKNVQADKEQFYRTTNEVITNVMSKTPRRSRLMDRIVATVEQEFWAFAVKVILEFLICCRREVSEL